MAFDPEQWQPVRLPSQGASLNADFPPQDAFTSRELTEMLDWCEKRCRGGWQHEAGAGKQTIFWFEQPGDAQQFALEWFPFRCL